MAAAFAQAGRYLLCSTTAFIIDNGLVFMLRVALLVVLVSFFVINAIAQNPPAVSIIPIPASSQSGSGELPITASFRVAVTGHRTPRIEHAIGRFLAQLSYRTGIPLSTALTDPASATLILHSAAAAGDIPQLGEGESYRLEVTPTSAKIEAPTDLGVLHGLQTFLQLLRESSTAFAVQSISIRDQPRFPWRGLMLDVSRHFLPLEVVRQNLDAMEAAKLNVLHLHLSDNQGFRFESKKLPKLQEMASDGLYYTQDELKELVLYAADRGIRVVPEFDLPGHSTALLVAYPEIASLPGPYEIERHWGIFEPTLDPTNDDTYKLLDKLFGEVAEVFPDPYLHIGGDEVDGKQWNTNPKIREFMRAHGMKSNDDLQTYFNQRLLDIVEKHHRIMVGWDEILHPDLPKTAVVQSWRGQKALASAAKSGYRGLLSNGYYLDLAWSAERHYSYDPVDPAANLSPEEQQRILGGEACMWSEYASTENLNSRVWPRAAAIAERLWSPANLRDVESMYLRMYRFGYQLDWLGLNHNTGYAEMLRRLTDGADISALRTLADVVEPVKDYTRAALHKVDPATQQTPLNRLVDTARPESETARQFRSLVNSFVRRQAPGGQNKSQIRAWLAAWRDNDARLQPLIQQEFLLGEVGPLSQQLAFTADAGLQALDYLDRGERPPRLWADQKSAVLAEAAKPRADVLIMIVPAVQQLVQAAMQIHER